MVRKVIRMGSRTVAIKAFAGRFIDIGVLPGATGPEVHQTRFTNIISWVSILLNMVYTGTYYRLGLGSAPLGNLVFGIANLIPVILNAMGRIYLARLILLASASVSMVFLASLGLESAGRPLFLALYVGPLFLFELKHRRWILASFGIVTLSVILTHLAGTRLNPAFVVNRQVLRGFRLSFLLLSGFILVVESWYFRWSWDRDRVELQELIRRYREARNELGERESQLVMAMEIAEMATWELDLVSGRLEFSPAMKSILGLPEGEPPSPEMALVMIVPEDRARVIAALNRWRAGGGKSADDVKFRVIRAGDGERWIQARGRIFHDSAGKPVRVRGISMDVTREKTAEQLISVQTAKMVASSKLSALGEMAGGIAHEINNPLAIIHARAVRLADLAASGNADHDLVAGFASQIGSTALRISRIIKALRSFARDGENDPMEVAQVRRLVEETAEMCRERLRNHGIDLVIDPIPDSMELRCRPVQISQVLLNLLNNAHDAVEELPERWIRVTTSEAPGDIFFRIMDSGRGIPPGVAHRIFEPFFTTKAFGRGTGLGLSISRGIIESHGGFLEVEARLDHTCFVIHLPKHRKADA